MGVLFCMFCFWLAYVPHMHAFSSVSAGQWNNFFLESKKNWWVDSNFKPQLANQQLTHQAAGCSILHWVKKSIINECQEPEERQGQHAPKKTSTRTGMQKEIQKSRGRRWEFGPSWTRQTQAAHKNWYKRPNCRNRDFRVASWSTAITVATTTRYDRQKTVFFPNYSSHSRCQTMKQIQFSWPAAVDIIGLWRPGGLKHRNKWEIFINKRNSKCVHPETDKQLGAAKSRTSPVWKESGDRDKIPSTKRARENLNAAKFEDTLKTGNWNSQAEKP